MYFASKKRRREGRQFSRCNVKKLLSDKWKDSMKSIISNVDASELTDCTGRTILHHAARHNNHELLDFLLDEGYDVDARDSSGTTPLVLAVSSNSYECIERLLERGADAFAANAAGRYALKAFSRKRRYTPRTLNLFLEQVRRRGGESDEATAETLAAATFPLDFVVELKNAQVTRLVLRKDKPVSRLESYRSMMNAFRSLDLDNMGVLLHHGEGMTERCFYFFEMFNRYAKSANPSRWGHALVVARKCIEWRLVNGGTIGFFERLFERSQRLPLKAFFQCDLGEHIRQALGYDSSIHVFGNRNVRLLDVLAESQVVGAVRARARGDLTALHLAVEYAVVRNVEWLLKKGADPNAATTQGLTPVFLALMQPDSPYGDDESAECIRLLLRYGADPRIRDNFGRTVFDVYEINDRGMPVMEVLLAHLALEGTLDGHVCDSILAVDLLGDRLKMCLRQVEQMKKLEVCESLSLFGVMRRSPGSLARVVGAQDRDAVAALVKGESVRQLSYYYRKTLEERLRQAVLIDDGRCVVAQVLADSVELLRGHTLVIDEIISYLMLDDLSCVRNEATFAANAS